MKSPNPILLMWRSHTFDNAIFETKFGEPRYKNFGLDMCLPSKSLVSRLDTNFSFTIYLLSLSQRKFSDLVACLWNHTNKTREMMVASP